MTHNIDYPLLIDQAMRGVVRGTLLQVARHGIPGDHHFFISFKTDFPGVSISKDLKARYPEGVTIVLQHQFWDLNVEDRWFSVTVSFNNVPEKLVVPYASITAFADPGVKFGLQFHDEQSEAQELDLAGSSAAPIRPDTGLAFEDENLGEDEDGGHGSAEIITLDAFRKKR